MTTLSYNDVSTVVNALRLARDKYLANVEELKSDPRFSRLADQFSRQAKDCERIANDMEE